MTIRTLFAAPALLMSALLLSAPALAQVTVPPPVVPAPPAAPTPLPVLQHVRLMTSAGEIILALDMTHAPLTAANFLAYVDQRRLDGVVFYRTMRFGPGSGLIQGGTRGDRARVLRPIPHEPTTTTGLSHTDMAISMARGAPGTADGDFFIIVGPQMIGLDANPAGSGDNGGYAVFARVVAGQDVIRTILAGPTSPTEGEGVMRGQMLSPVVRILTARRVAAPPPPPPPITVQPPIPGLPRLDGVPEAGCAPRCEPAVRPTAPPAPQPQSQPQ